MKSIHLFFLSLTVFLSLPVYARGPLNIPFRSGQHVYTDRAGWLPTGMNQNDVRSIEEAAGKAYHPFYTVFLSDLPGTGDENRRIQEATDNLMGDWAADGTGYDISKSTVFLIVWNDDCVKPKSHRRSGTICKYFMNSGKFWKESTGFVARDSHQNYTRHFLDAVKTSPPDVRLGVVGTMNELDVFFRMETDPAVLAARAATQAAMQEQRHLRDARNMLDNMTGELSKLLSQKQYLPQDISRYEQTMEKAQEVGRRDNPSEMLAYAESMSAPVNELKQYVDGKVKEERRIIFFTCLISLLGALLVVGVLTYILRRLSKWNALQVQFKNWHNRWAVLISNFDGQYVQFFKKRDDLIDMKKTTGRTGELYGQVTKEVDGIYLAVRAMESHVRRCSSAASQATYFNQKPMADALHRIDSEFEFDTGEVNESDLFGSPTKTVKVMPAALVADLKKRFTSAVEGWKKLKIASDMRMVEANQHFAHEKLSQMLKSADENGIPHKWLSDHPLFGDDAADQALWDTVGAMRWTDPLGYAEKIEELLKKEREIETRLTRLLDAVNKVGNARIDSLPDFEGTVFGVDDDPRITLDSARLEEDKLHGRLSSREKVEEIEEKANEVCDLYKKCALQVATIESAVKGAEGAIAEAVKSFDEASSEVKSAWAKATEAARIHKNCKAETYIENGRQFMQVGAGLLDKAKQKLLEKRHIAARQSAEQAVSKLNEASHQFKEAVKHCKALDDQKAAYEKKLAEMAEIRRDAEKKIKKYNGSTDQMQSFSAPATDGLLDYAILMSTLSSVENSWRNEERCAHTAYTAEQARIAAVEAQKAREEKEQESPVRPRTSGSS